MICILPKPAPVRRVYRCERGLARTHGEDALGFFDAFEGVFAAVFERHAGGGAGEAADGVGHQHLAGSGEGADAGGNVDGATENVVLLADGVAGVEAEAQGGPGRRPTTRGPTLPWL